MKHLLILGGTIAVLFVLARGTVIPGPYTYDEPDYIYAASLGVAANAFDSPTIPLREFLRIGLNRGRDVSARTELSEAIRDKGDVVFYRHWHGPLYSYWLMLVRRFRPGELTARTWNLAFPIIAMVLIYFGALWVLPGAAGRTAAVVCGALYLWGYPVVRSTELGPHQLFTLSAAVALVLLAKMMTGPAEEARRCWYGAVIASAIAFCLLEVAFALILTAAICGHLVRERLRPGLGLGAKSIGLFAGTVLVVWPGAVFRFSWVKAYLFMAYLAVFRRNAWGAGATIAGTWWLRFVQSPIPWILAAAGLVYLVRRRREASVLTPFAVFTLLMAAAIFTVRTNMARYALPVWPGAVLLAGFAAGLAMAKWRTMARVAATGLLCAAMLATTWPSVRANLPRLDTRVVSMLALVRERHLEQARMLAPHSDVPMLHYYFPRAKLMQYADDAAVPDPVGVNVDGVIDRSNPARWLPAREVR